MHTDEHAAILPPASLRSSRGTEGHRGGEMREKLVKFSPDAGRRPHPDTSVAPRCEQVSEDKSSYPVSEHRHVEIDKKTHLDT